MDLGNKINKIRKDNNLTQEDFAEKYNVTRQTISNWENGKSYPDLETLVKISDDFSVSLDVLLKEDKKVIMDISKNQKNSKLYKRIALALGAVVGIALLAIGVYFGMYYAAKAKLENQFEKAIKENNFYKNADGYYTLDYNESISYDVPNQKLPIESGYNFHFFAMHLDCNIDLNEENYLEITWIDYDYYDADLIDKKTGEIEKSVGLLGRDNVNQIKEITDKIQVDENLLREAVDKGNDLYKQFYK
ncbi:MAG: helix-turn-helix transcriptional regulator [Clostridia bacterium]|nr:helix-turn-helix transcriptional regulator [Clostridia bacterium]